MHQPRTINRFSAFAARFRAAACRGGRAWLLSMLLLLSAMSSAFAEDTDDAAGDVARAEPVSMDETQESAEAAFEIVQRPDDDLLLLEIRLNDLVLVDAMFAYLSGSSILLPLRDLTDTLEFPIAVETFSATANGWFLSPNRLFSLNIGRGELIINGEITLFDPRLVEVHEDDIYVDIRLLAQWFPIDLIFDLSNLIVDINSREPLPIEQKIARDDYRQRLLTRRVGDDSTYQEIENPYQAFSVLTADVDTSTTVDRDENGDTAISTQHSITATGDIGFASAELFVGGDNREKTDDVRLKLSRIDPEGRAFSDIEMLKDLDVTEASLGDINSPQLSLISRTELGRGIQVSNMSVEAPSEFDRITLTGDLPLGWEIEVYRNEVLLDFQTASDDGRYVFEDVPLVFGVNVLRIIQYGPQGQVEEEIRQFNVGPGQTKTGELDVRFTANQHDRPFLVNDEDADEELEGDGRLFAEAQYGLSRNVTIGGNLAQVPMEQGTQRYATASLNFTLGSWFGRYDAIKQAGEGWAQRFSAQTNVMGVNVLGEHSIFNNFFSEQISEADDALASSSTLRFDGALPGDLASFIPRMPFSLEGQHDIRESGDSDTTLRNRLSAALGPASLTNNLNYTLDRSDENSTSTLNGSTLIGGRVGDVRVRGSVGYDVIPVKEFDTVGLSGDWRVSDIWRGSAGIERDLGDDASTTYSAGVNARFDAAYVGLDVDYTDTEQFTSKMTLSFGLGYDEERGDLFLKAGGIARSGALSAFVFLDSNDNGIFDEDEEPIEGARVTIDSGRHSDFSDIDGKIFVTSLPGHQRTTITLDQASLPDPFWVSTQEGYAMTPRPGTVASISIPVVSTGEVDGTVFRAWTEGTSEAAGVIVQLVDDEGEVVRELKSAFDGFFLFDFVRPGRYTLRVAPEQLNLLGLIADNEYEVEIFGDGTIVSGQDFILETPALAAEQQSPSEGWGAVTSVGENANL